jgi:Rad3-related DNA helicase
VPAVEEAVYRVAVRALCEFTAKTGDLDLRFTPAPTAQEGIAGHRTVASRRSVAYQAEVTLQGQYRELQVKGRADGYDPESHQLEEVKTYRGDFDAIPANHRQLHWAQLKVYGWLLCQREQRADVTLALVYFNIINEKETVLRERHDAESLRMFFEAQCEVFLDWARQEMAHVGQRNQLLNALKFPHAEFRHGQRSLAETVYKAVSSGRCLMAQAPTGIGKTLGTLFPMLKAMPTRQLDKVIFLTAKTPGRKLALDALEVLRERDPELPVRVLELVARDKACEHPDKACHGQSCPLARGFYDRLPAARQAAVNAPWLDQAGLRDVALQHEVCPYYLSQEMARWADVVIADYNYYFDLSALLFGLAQLNQWRVAALVDEAHNMVERCRQMYSASLDQRSLDNLRDSAVEPLKKPLQKLHRAWNSLHKDQVPDYQAYATPPDKFINSLSQCVTALGDYFNDHPQALEGPLQSFYFELIQFMRIAELFDEHFIFDISKREAGRRELSRLCLRNVVPAAFIGPRLKAARSTVLFSATLSPRHYYADLLGLPADTAWIDVESPFNRQQLDVQIISRISTRYTHRQASLAPIVELMAEQFQARPGNYLAFFSSFDYLQQVFELMQRNHPQVPLWSQARGMSEGERQAFLERFTPQSQGIGFAVLGGAFGEGIDLPGARLIGAFIATLGLAQFNPVNEQLKQRMTALYGAAGYDYTYLFPGVQKVVQAAGRVIRTQQDRGVVMLIDDRFAERKVLNLLPAWWQL